MSFNCEICRKHQKDGSKPEKIIDKVREKAYPVRYNSNGEVIDSGGSGYEIVSEITACQTCYKKRV